MGQRYSVIGTQTPGTDKTFVSIMGIAGRHRRIREIIVSSPAAPADQTLELSIARITADGTGTAYTPVALDQGDPAATSGGVKVAHSAEPTYTAGAELMRVAINQRATYRWIATPGSELVIDASTGQGIGIKTLSSTGTASHICTVIFEE